MHKESGTTPDGGYGYAALAPVMAQALPNVGGGGG